MKIFSLFIFLSFCLCGCGAQISGQLQNIDLPRTQLSLCKNSNAFYQIKIEAEKVIVNSDNPALYLSLITLGIVPSYWSDSYSTKATIFNNEREIAKFDYVGSIEKYYGFLWAIFLQPEKINRIYSGYELINKTIDKAIQDANVTATDVCLFY